MTDITKYSESVATAIALVWREAELLDQKEYEAWDALYAEDSLYIVPIVREWLDDYSGGLNLVHDDARMRRMRVERFKQGYSISAADSARTVRTVSRFVPTTVERDRVILRSAQILVSYKRENHAVLAADVVHEIALAPNGPLIKRKVIRLLNSDASVQASGYLL